MKVRIPNMKTICIDAPTLAVTAEWDGHKSGNKLTINPNINQNRVYLAHYTTI